MYMLSILLGISKFMPSVGALQYKLVFRVIRWVMMCWLLMQCIKPILQAGFVTPVDQIARPSMFLALWNPN